MSKEIELWQFVSSRLNDGEPVMLLVVAASSGSSPGRAGYKMAVAADGDLYGSIGGGVMEVNLVELAKSQAPSPKPHIIEQVHRHHAENASGMICSGRQTVILKQLTFEDIETVDCIVGSLNQQKPIRFEISNLKFQIVEKRIDNSPRFFLNMSETEFVYSETLGTQNELFIIGGGHCALALSELMSRLEFRISIFDDRPELNTLEKNTFADAITIVDDYANIGSHIPAGDNIYVVVMTLGYKFDEIVIRSLFDHDLKYFGVLGSLAKMKTLLTTLEKEGFDKEKLARIRTPIGLPISSQTPEEIAVSIAAEIISVKNTDL